LPWFPRLLRESGYYTAIVGKHHMTSCSPTPGTPPQPEPFDLVDPGSEPGNNGGHATWVKTLRERPADKPFFCWFAAKDAHRAWDADKEWREDVYGPMHDPRSVIVPPFLVDTPETRQDLASYYNEITRFDYFVGQVVQELQRQDVLADTLLLVMADNGRAFPRAKTRLHDSGMKTPFIVHWPAGLRQPGIPTRSLVSAIDIAPTFLEAAGVPVPSEMQGVSFLPVLTSPAARVRQCAFSEHNWHDHEAHGRAVRADGFLYIRNQRPQFPWQGPNDSVHSPSFLSVLAARDTGKLTPHQADILLAPRPVEELYQTITDTDQMHNLASNPEYAVVKAKLARLLNEWTDATGDSCPAKLTPDMYPRDPTRPFEKPAKKDFRGDWPGFDRGADRINAPGPR
jgi:arylsulfatase A-like enzyme